MQLFPLKITNWLECPCYHYLLLKNQFANTLLRGDPIIAGLSRYLKVWQKYFTPVKTLNLGTGRKRAENVLWQAMNLSIPSSLKNAIVLRRSNNLFTDSTLDIGDCIVNISSCLLEKSSNIKVFICGLIPRDESWSINRVLIKDFNRILKYLCLKHDYSSLIYQSNGWTLPNGDLDHSLFFRDFLHLIEEGNVKLTTWINKSTVMQIEKALINDRLRVLVS